MITKVLELIGLQPEEKLLLVGDETTDWAVEQLASYATATYLLSADTRPLQAVPKDLEALVKGVDVLLYIISKASSDERVFRDSLNSFAESRGVRVANLLDVTPEILVSAFREDPQKIRAFTEDLCERMRSVQNVRVTSPSGTNVTVSFSKKYFWVASTGYVEFAKTRNAMPAEIYTHPANVEGVVVVDGAYAALVGLEDSKELLAALKKHPLTWEIQNSRIVNVRCTHERIRELASKEIFEKDPENGNRIGEFGIGTNLGMKELFGNVMHDEKFPGVHIAHGHGYSSATGAEYSSSVHSDGVLLEASIADLDSGDQILLHGHFLQPHTY